MVCGPARRPPPAPRRTTPGRGSAAAARRSAPRCTALQMQLATSLGCHFSQETRVQSALDDGDSQYPGGRTPMSYPSSAAKMDTVPTDCTATHQGLPHIAGHVIGCRFNSRHEGSNCVSMAWRAIPARPLPATAGCPRAPHPPPAPPPPRPPRRRPAPRAGRILLATSSNALWTLVS